MSQTKLKKLPLAIALTLSCGLAFADEFIECLEEKLSIPVRMGIVKDVTGDISTADSVRLSTAVGLVKYAAGKHAEKIHDRKVATKTLSEKVIDIFNNYF